MHMLRPPLQRGLMNFKLLNVQLYNKSLNELSRGKHLIVFLSNLNVSFGLASENIEILAKQNQLFQSLSVYYYPWGGDVGLIIFPLGFA